MKARTGNLVVLPLLALAACTIADGRGDLAILPTGPLLASGSLTIEIRAPSGSRAAIWVDGRERDAVATNAAVRIDTSEMADGEHSLLVKVFDGPYPDTELVRSFRVDRTRPTAVVEPPPGAFLGPGPLRVQVTFSEPIDPATVPGNLVFRASQVGLLPATVTVTEDGRSATATLDVPLIDYQSATLEVGVSDPAGNVVSSVASSFGSAPVTWFVPSSLVHLSTLPYVDQSLEATVTIGAGWAGATGPITVYLCGFEPGSGTPRVDSCPSAVVTGPGQVATFDTSTLTPGDYHLTARIQGYRESVPVRVLILRKQITVDLFTSETLVNGPVLLVMTGSGSVPPLLEVLMGDTVIATITNQPRVGPMGAQILWSANAPDGVYTPTVRAAGWQVILRSAPSIEVDRTPPTATARASVLDAGLDGALWLDFSEPVTGSAVLSHDGVAVWTEVMSFPTERLLFSLSRLGSLPWSDSVVEWELSGLRDRAGNAPAQARGSASLPVWYAPVGAGSLQVGGAPLLAAEAVAGWACAPSPQEDLAITFIDLAGQVRAGHLSGLLPDALGAPGSVSSGLLSIPDWYFCSVSSAAWKEVSSGGASIAVTRLDGSVLTAYAPATTSFDATPPRAGPVSRGGFSHVTWTESDGAGARAFRYRTLDDSIEAPMGALPTSAFDAVEDCCVPGGTTGQSALLAWIDGAGPVQQLALSTAPATAFLSPSGSWSLLVPSANADSGQAASDPALAGGQVAWLEGGRVRAGRVVSLTGGFARDDPPSASGSRRPVLMDSGGGSAVLLFVEPGPAGDVIAARRWTTETGWISLPPVNVGVTGSVVNLAASRSLVTWTDPDGRVFVRRLNRLNR